MDKDIDTDLNFEAPGAPHSNLFPREGGEL